MSDCFLSAWGRLGNDPKAITTTTGKPMTVATLAVNLGGAEDAAPLWLGLVAFGGQAEILLRHTKGDCLSIAGRLQRRDWTDKSGVARQDLQLVVDHLVSARTVRPGGKRQTEKKDAGNDKDFDDPLDF
jgi:single-strand DNA-binding protein